MIELIGNRVLVEPRGCGIGEVLIRTVVKRDRHDLGLHAGDEILCVKTLPLDTENAAVDIADVVAVQHAPQPMPEAPVETPEEIEARRLAGEAFAASLVEQARLREERDAYKPDPPQRVLLPDGRVSYEASASAIVQPGAVESVQFGAVGRVSGTGWPGLLDTAWATFGATERFQPEEVRFDPPFALCQFYVGAQVCVAMPHDATVPAEALAPGKPQPKYPIAEAGIVMSLSIKNTGDRQLPFRGRIIGREVNK